VNTENPGDIPSEMEVISGSPTRLNPKEFGGLSAPAKMEYHRQELVNQLESERDRLLEDRSKDQVELVALRKVEVDHARIKQSRKRKRVVSAVMAFLMLAGSGLISGYSLSDGPGFGVFSGNQLYAIGWAIVIVAGLTQLCGAVFDG